MLDRYVRNFHHKIQRVPCHCIFYVISGTWYRFQMSQITYIDFFNSITIFLLSSINIFFKFPYCLFKLSRSLYLLENLCAIFPDFPLNNECLRFKFHYFWRQFLYALCYFQIHRNKSLSHHILVIDVRYCEKRECKNASFTLLKPARVITTSISLLWNLEL